MSARRRSPVLLVCCCLTAYFAFHAVRGKHGLEARHNLELRSVKLGNELAALNVVRGRLEREVELLGDSHPDPAFVEEIAREMLAYARLRDRILLAPGARFARLSRP